MAGPHASGNRNVAAGCEAGSRLAAFRVGRGLALFRFGFLGFRYLKREGRGPFRWIAVSGEEGKGCAFTVRLPIATADA